MKKLFDDNYAKLDGAIKSVIDAYATDTIKRSQAIEIIAAAFTSLADGKEAEFLSFLNRVHVNQFIKRNRDKNKSAKSIVDVVTKN